MQITVFTLVSAERIDAKLLCRFPPRGNQDGSSGGLESPGVRPTGFTRIPDEEFQGKAFRPHGTAFPLSLREEREGSFCITKTPPASLDYARDDIGGVMVSNAPFAPCLPVSETHLVTPTSAPKAATSAVALRLLDAICFKYSFGTLATCFAVFVFISASLQFIFYLI